jgi:small subunit ribosomal protein S6e
MAEFKLVLSDPKTGKSIQREAKDMSAKSLIGKKIGDAVKGESFDLPGYEFVITGGSDFAGFPMRHDVLGAARKRITAVKGIGVNNKIRKPNPKKKGWRKMEGMRQKKTVAGNTIYEKTAQVNMKVTKKGREPLFGEEPAKAEAKPEAAEKKEEKPKAAPKKKVEKAAPEKTEKLAKDAEALEAAAEKDAAEVEEEDEEIAELDKELKKADKDLEE